MLEVVDDLSSKWRAFFLKLGLRLTVLDRIQQDHRDVRSCLTEALGEWLKLNYDHQKYGRPSWKKLAEAARKLDYRIFESIVVSKIVTTLLCT